MAAALRTQQGRTLHYADLSAEDICRLVRTRSRYIEGGRELGSDGREIFVATRHVVEWWDKS